MHADRDLSFLQEGIVDMLTSRLSSEDSVVVARKDTDRVLQDLSGPVNEENARAIGTKLEADYVLFGSLTMFGNSISLDAKMVDVHQKRPTLTLFDQSTKIDDVIPQINLFAAEINEKVFGRAVVARRLPEQPQQRPSLYAHPETLMTGPTGGPVQVPGERLAQTAGPGFEEVEGVPSVDTASAGFWKSQNLKMPIKGLALGDVDGDGKAEVVFIDDRQVHVYRFENKRFLKIKEIAGKRNQRLIGVDAADINGNGYAEIFVTTLTTPGQSLNSFVLESDGQDFNRISEEDPWYYRVIDMPDQGKVLVGQRRTMKDLFVAGVSRLAWVNGRYEPAEPVRLPKGVNIFGFAFGDVTDNEGQMIIAFDEDDRIRLFSPSGGEQWRSEESYGGSMNYLEINPETSRTTSGERLYLPQRIYARDVNGDGRDEVIVASNQGSLGRLFATFRKFTSGQMVCLSANGYGLMPKLQTPKVSGYISDYAVGDFDADGIDEVVVAAVRSKGTLVTEAKSSVMAYELTQLPSSAPQQN
jgi:TolB-like protein